MDLSGLGIGKCGRYHTWSGFSTSGKTLRMYRLSSVGTTQVHHCKLWQVLGISEVVSLCFADSAWPLWNYLVGHGPWFSRATRHCVHPQTLRSQQPYLWLSSPSSADPLKDVGGGSDLAVESFWGVLTSARSSWSIRWWYDLHLFSPHTLLLKHSSPLWPSARQRKHNLHPLATSHRFGTVILLKLSQDQIPCCPLHTLHAWLAFFLSSGESLVTNDDPAVGLFLSFLGDSLRTPLMVSEAVVRNSDSLSINSLNVLTSSVRWLSLTHCLYLDKALY